MATTARGSVVRVSMPMPPPAMVGIGMCEYLYYRTTLSQTREASIDLLLPRLNDESMQQQQHCDASCVGLSTSSASFHLRTSRLLLLVACCCCRKESFQLPARTKDPKIQKDMAGSSSFPAKSCERIAGSLRFHVTLLGPKIQQINNNNQQSTSTTTSNEFIISWMHMNEQ